MVMSFVPGTGCESRTEFAAPELFNHVGRREILRSKPRLDLRLLQVR